MSNLILYHGGKCEVTAPKYGLGEIKHDYGKGFYTTKDKSLACEWSCFDNTDGICNKYTVNTSGLRVFDFGKYSVLNWIAELLSHRSGVASKVGKLKQSKFLDKYKLDTKGSDIITGYRADDSYFRLAKDFINGDLSVDVLDKCMRLGGLGIQFAIISKKSFDLIKFDSSTPANARIFYEKASLKDKKARETYDKILESKENINGKK